MIRFVCQHFKSKRAIAAALMAKHTKNVCLLSFSIYYRHQFSEFRAIQPSCNANPFFKWKPYFENTQSFHKIYPFILHASNSYRTGWRKCWFVYCISDVNKAFSWSFRYFFLSVFDTFALVLFLSWNPDFYLSILVVDFLAFVCTILFFRNEIQDIFGWMCFLFDENQKKTYPEFE